MAGQRQPTNLLMLRGKKHFTKAELEERLAREVNAPADRVSPPGYLTGKQKQQFIDLACDLLDIGIMANLDCDALARYVQSQCKYLEYDRCVNRLLDRLGQEGKDKHGAEREQALVGAMIALSDALKTYENLRDKAFKQCRQAAADLGLTISSRCRLVVPKKEKRDDPNAGLFGDEEVG